jgi:hypothetical protein
MPRPKPEETLHTISYRLTEKQLSKIARNGGPTWLRHIIDQAEESEALSLGTKYAARNKAIAADTRPPKVIADDYGLGLHYVYLIRRRERASSITDIHPTQHPTLTTPG